VASGTPQVDETAFSEKDNVTPVLHEEAVNLRLDILHALGVLLQPSNINLNIEVANVYKTLIGLKSKRF
jgi:hypothetical protein